MAQFIFAYHGGKAPQTQEEIDRVMAAWEGWIGKYEGNIKDPGNPVGQSFTVSSSGVADNGGANPLSGYSMIEADDMNAALKIASECPQLEEGTVEVAEIFPM